MREDAPRRPSRALRALPLVALVLLVAVPLLLRALDVWAEVVVNLAFFDALGVEPVYERRWRTNALLIAIGLGVALLLALPLARLAGRRPLRRGAAAAESGELRGGVGDSVPPGPRRLLRLGLPLAGFVILSTVIVPGLLGRRDEILAAREAVPVGVEDPVFGRDISFFLFEAPLLREIGLLLAAAAVIGLVLVVVGSVARLLVTPGERTPELVRRVANQHQGVAYLYGGLLGLGLATSLWYGRYAAVTGGDELVAGAGRAERDVGIPGLTVLSIVALAVGLGVAALALPLVRRRLGRLGVLRALRVMAGAWILIALVLVIVSSPWWLPLLVPGVALLLLAPAGERIAVAGPARFGTPAWLVAGFAGVTIVGGVIATPLATAIYDGVALRGTRLQVERDNIQATLDATRRASGIDQLTERPVDYRRDGVTRAAIEDAPASVRSLRFLDFAPVQSACQRLQTVNRFYTCADVDLDRYEGPDGPETRFVIGREVDYASIGDFQRRHFAYTHGRGIAMAPVNRIDTAGRPDFVVAGLDSTGLEPPLTRPEIYFGAQPDMPWAMVNTSQPDGFSRQPVPWSGDTGIPVGENRLALTLHLGGLPFIGGGRRIWNATAGEPAGEDSDLLLNRDIVTRVRTLAPFLSVDADPYFVASEGRLFVLLNAYTDTDRYPYAVRFGNASYVRQSVTAVMDAYSGETRLYVMDDEDPLIATWRKVYPELFTDGAEMPATLRAHLRYGEDLFDFQSAALGAFHVTDVDRLFSGEDAWTVTRETVGAGVDGTSILSPARYTYALLPGEEEERFRLLRYFKPAVADRGIGFSAWLAADNDPGRFGRLTLLRFDTASAAPLDSVDTFAANIARDPDLSAQIGVREEQVRRGNVIVVPIGEGLLYVQPLYLDAADSLPTLWQVVVSFGDGRVFTGPSFATALTAALGAGGGEEPAPAGDGGPGPAPGAGADLEALVAAAAAAFEAQQQAFGRGDFEEAGRQQRRLAQLLERAQELSATPRP